jgi:hypothetical protein
MRTGRVLVSAGLLLLLFLLLVRPTDSNRRWRRRQQQPPDEQLQQHSQNSEGSLDALAALNLHPGCGRLLIDGGTNTGESVRAFLKGSFFTCALHSPNRQYSSVWPQLSRAERQRAMRPLHEPSTFCIRSFEAAPELMPMLRNQELDLRARSLDVQFVEAALSNVTSLAAPRNVVRYAKNPWGSTAVGLGFEEVHVGGKPVALSTRTVIGQSYDLREIVSRALALNASSVIAVKLDIEGFEYRTLEALVAERHLLCSISYIFVEFHSTASAEQRSILTRHGIREDAFEALKARVHAAMETPGCKLKVYWRSFWASCGDKQRFEWRTSAQAESETIATDVPI